MTLYEALDMIDHGETSEQYKKRIAKIRRYANERDFLEDTIKVLEEDNDPRAEKKRARLAKVNRMLQELV